MSTDNEPYANVEQQEKSILRYLVAKLWEQHREKGIVLIDSNIHHFMIYDMCENNKTLGEKITRAWFYHGPYIYYLDDVLVEFGMDEKYHQMKSDHPEAHNWVETRYVVVPEDIGILRREGVL